MAEKRVHWEHFQPFLLPMEGKTRHWAHLNAFFVWKTFDPILSLSCDLSIEAGRLCV
jgi:hypothetical protein